MIIEQLTVGPLQENCWLIADEQTRECVLIDPGDEADRLLDAVHQAGCTLTAIWLTHAHFDHLGAVADILRRYAVPVHLHPADQPLYERARESGMLYGLQIETPPPVSDNLTEGGRVSIGSTVFTVWHVPGHSPGHVAFISDEYCFSGDLLFAGSVGRTDLPLCDARAMHASLLRVATLAPVVRVFPGHGKETTIARELASNPFLRGIARPISVSA